MESPKGALMQKSVDAPQSGASVSSSGCASGSRWLSTAQRHPGGQQQPPAIRCALLVEFPCLVRTGLPVLVPFQGATRDDSKPYVIRPMA